MGASHIKSGKPCQDASTHSYLLGGSFVAVADGHGSEPYFRSDIGSKLAVKAASECMNNVYVTDALKANIDDSCAEKRGEVIQQLKKSIIGRWNVLVGEHFSANPFTDTEYSDVPEKYVAYYRRGEQIEVAYGATLIATLRTDDFTLALQIGDGSCFVLDNDGVLSEPVPECPKCIGNTTTSLCEKDAFDNFRHFFTSEPPAAVVIGTDGIEKSFAVPEKLHNFVRMMLSSFVKSSEKDAKAELFDYLPRMSSKGSGDDISIGVIADVFVLGKFVERDDPGVPPDESDFATPEPLEIKWEDE
jgi:hypothetical protein